MTSVLAVCVNPSVDISASVPAIQPDHKLHCQGVHTEAGGGGVNVARVVQRFGHVVQLITTVGGSNGTLLQKLLENDGVAITAVPVAADTRESLTVTEVASSRQYRFVLPGPQLAECEFHEFVRAVRANSADHGFVVISGSLPPNAPASYVAELVEAAGRSNARVIVDTSGDALQDAARAGVLLLKPSLNELSVHAGRPLNTIVDFEQAARELLARGDNRAVLVSLGASGALLVERDSLSRVVHAPPVKALSTVGAGDSLVAGFVVGLLRGLSLPEAARCAVAAGSAAVLRAGTALCEPVDAEALLPNVHFSTAIQSRR